MSIDDLTDALYECDFNGSGYMMREDCRAMAEAIMPLLPISVTIFDYGIISNGQPEWGYSESYARLTGRPVIRRSHTMTADVFGPTEFAHEA